MATKTTKPTTKPTKTVDIPPAMPQPLRSVRFEAFVSKTIFFETSGRKDGAYTNDPDDSGKETKWGISKAAHPDLSIKTLTYKDATDIYYKEYYSPLYDFIVDADLAFKLFDMGVLMGVHAAVKLLQKATIACGVKTRVDGLFGPMTLTATSMGALTGINVYEQYIKRLTRRVNWSVILKPKNIKYIAGWKKRINTKFSDKPVKENKDAK
jgi:lysozyme family protein